VPPLRIGGAASLRGIQYTAPVASAQVKSAILLAGLYARGETDVREVHPTRDYTERMLAAFGWPIEFEPGRARLSGGHRLARDRRGRTRRFLLGGVLHRCGDLAAGLAAVAARCRFESAPHRPARCAALMGADIRELNVREQGGERVADLDVRHAGLRGIDIPVALVPDMIDEFPILFVAAAVATGTTTVRGATELRVKESDRIAVMAKGLATLGVRIEETPDGAIIHGGVLQGGSVDSAGDHRCAMSFAVAGLLARDGVRVSDCANVATSFPGFVDSANACGFRIAALEGG